MTTLLAKLAKAMKLPELEAVDAADFGRPGASELPGVRVDFSVLRVSRKVAAEKVFIKMLLGTEEDLADLKGPMTFPVFGQGRALYALVDKGINEANIIEACEFLVGPCSCQVKQQNPGVDLLITANWMQMAGAEMVVPRALPPLTGISELIDPSKVKSPTSRPATRPAGTGSERTTP